MSNREGIKRRHKLAAYWIMPYELLPCKNVDGVFTEFSCFVMSLKYILGKRLIIYISKRKKKH